MVMLSNVHIFVTRSNGFSIETNIFFFNFRSKWFDYSRIIIILIASTFKRDGLTISDSVERRVRY